MKKFLPLIILFLLIIYGMFSSYKKKLNIISEIFNNSHEIKRN